MTVDTISRAALASKHPVVEPRPSTEQLIGMRIRERRIVLGLSQHQLGELIGVAYQQVYKYEHGINGVSAGRLYKIAQELGTPVDYFFEGLEQSESQAFLRQRRLLDIMRTVSEIQNERYQAVISQIVRSLARG
jgi:transcriptional regulator with XRE-family HTH domain